MKKAFLQLHTAILLAGVTGVLGRLIHLNEAWLVFYRLLFTVAILWALYAFSKTKTPLNGRAIRTMLGIGAVVGLHWVSFYGSIKYANVSVALVAFSSLGFFSAVLEPFILRKPLSWIELALGLLAVLGVALIFHFDTRYEKGILFGGVSAFLGALFTVLNKKVMERHDAETVTRWEMTGGLLTVTLILPFYLPLFGLGFELPSFSDIGWLILLAWCCTVWAFKLSLRALEKISPFTVNLSYNLEPLYGILLAFALFQENRELQGSFYLGSSLILLAIVLQMVKVFAEKKR